MDKKDFQTRYANGLKTRREMMGAERTDKAVAAADDFSRPMQELLNTYCFNDIWNRPGLARKTRSMLNLGILAALNRTPQLKSHLNGAITNGVSKEEIQEIFLQVAVYCGVPAAVEAFNAAREVFKERGI